MFTALKVSLLYILFSCSCAEEDVLPIQPVEPTAHTAYVVPQDTVAIDWSLDWHRDGTYAVDSYQGVSILFDLDSVAIPGSYYTQVREMIDLAKKLLSDSIYSMIFKKTTVVVTGRKQSEFCGTCHGYLNTLRNWKNVDDKSDDVIVITLFMEYELEPNYFLHEVGHAYYLWVRNYSPGYTKYFKPFQETCRALYQENEDNWYAYGLVDCPEEYFAELFRTYLENPEAEILKKDTGLSFIRSLRLHTK